MRPRRRAAKCGCRPGIRTIRCSTPCAGTTTPPSPRSSSRSANRPPFGFQALLRAEARSQEAAQAFLKAAGAAAAGLDGADRVTLYSAVPLSIQRVANIERAQMLIESASRTALQRFLAAWHPVLHATREKGLIRWAVDVDPLVI